VALGAQEADIERGVVRHQYGPFENPSQSGQHLCKGGLSAYVLRRDSMDLPGCLRHLTLRVDQLTELLPAPTSRLPTHDGHLADSVARRNGQARGLEVQDRRGGFNRWQVQQLVG
jgi:hypothetical protein